MNLQMPKNQKCRLKGAGLWNSVPFPTLSNKAKGVAVLLFLVGTGYSSSASLVPGGVVGDGQTSLVYHPDTGEVLVDAPPGVSLTAINIESAAGLFTGPRPDELTGTFDDYSPSKLFKLSVQSFGSISFGAVFDAGLNESLLLSDLTVTGALVGGGGLGNVDLVVAEICTPPSELGDLNGDGALTSSDVDVLSFQIRSTPPSPAFDLTGDGVVDSNDHTFWVHEIAGTWFGDADLNGEFTVGDISLAIIAGKYNTGELALWHEGDWNGDRVFDLRDLLLANRDGGYNEGPAGSCVGGGGSGVLPLTVFEAFGEDPLELPLGLDIVTFSIGDIEGVLLSWETSSLSVQLQRTTSLSGTWEDVTVDATPDDDGRTYVALTDLTSSEFFRLSVSEP